MRVYPRGSRIASSNLVPLAFWAVGAHVCALNGQTFGASNQLNDALFRGLRGFILKPPDLRAGRLPALPPRRTPTRRARCTRRARRRPSARCPPSTTG